ncbi:MAG: hypothetical protein WBE26_02525 [Phycisphaerae bacterium]
MAKTTALDNAGLPRRSAAGVGGSEGGPGVLKDVWSRSRSRYRIRAIVLLAVNVLLFAGVGSFAFWLRSGVRFAPTQEGYWDELKHTFWSVPMIEHGDGGISLGSLLLEPISVRDVPMQIPILGLLMAALISIPILVSILYRFWSSLPFIAVVGFLAVMPWLAITLLGSCVLASVRTFRTRFRFMSALLGLLPAVVYLVLAWSGTTEVVAGKIDPVDRIKFYAPWVMAIVAAAVLFAIVLAIAKVVDYRPGAITPLLAIMFGLPVALFEFHVGRDELYYRLLEALDEAHFADVDASLELDQAVMNAWFRQPPPRRSVQAIRDTVETRWLFELAADIGPVQSAVTRHQAEVVDRCDWFHKYFPHSRYTLSALFIKARALDTRVDPGEFRRTKWIRFYDDFPSPASREAWRVIAENRPRTLLGVVALLRLAQVDARDGDVERAVAKLTTLLEQSGSRGARGDTASTQTRPLKAVLAPESPETSLDIPGERTLLEAHRLYDLFTANRDPIYGYEPIGGARYRTGSFPFGLMDLDPRHRRYIENLRALEARYPNCQIKDNIDLEIAKATSSPTLKIERLEACLERFPHRDAAPETLFRLGVAYKADDQAKASEDVFARLFREYTDSVWTKQAARYLPWRAASFPPAGGRGSTQGAESQRAGAP